MSLSSESEHEPVSVKTVIKQAEPVRHSSHRLARRLSLGPEQRSSLEQHRGREHQRGARHGWKQARARRGAKLEKMLQLQSSASRFAIDMQLSRAL